MIWTRGLAVAAAGALALQPIAAGAQQACVTEAEVGAIAVHPVHEAEPREGVLLGVLRHLLGLDLDPRHRVDHDDRAFDDPQSGPRLGHEVAVDAFVADERG